MPIYSLTKERVEDLQKRIREKQAEIDELEKLTVEDIWVSELDRFERAYIAELKEREQFFSRKDSPFNERPEAIQPSQKQEQVRAQVQVKQA
jgi:hypothetical protein